MSDRLGLAATATGVSVRPNALRFPLWPQPATAKRDKRENLRPWKPGQSGNPSGRPKGIATQARELIGDDPSRLLNVFLEIAEDTRQKAADRRAAAESLLDRAYGKAPAYAPIDGENPLELDSIARRIAAVVDELAARRETHAPGEAAQGELAGTG